MPEFHLETLGSGARIVLVHGSVANGATAFSTVLPLAERFTLAIVDRPGYPPNPQLERIDFDVQAGQIAELLEDGDHLVGHSYGGVIALLAAAHRPSRLRSLVVSEPPAFGIARGHSAVEDVVSRFSAFAEGGPHEPRDYLAFFAPFVGSTMEVPDPLPPELEAGTRAAMAERPPYEAEIPLDALRAAPFPKLVLSGSHSAAFDAVCDVLERELGAERLVLPGAGHSLPRAPGYPEALAAFVEAAER